MEIEKDFWKNKIFFATIADRANRELEKIMSPRSATVLCRDFTIHEDWYMLATGTA